MMRPFTTWAFEPSLIKEIQSWRCARREPQEPRAPLSPRVMALRMFGFTITVFTLLGAFVLGFEDSWAQPLTAAAVAYTFELLLETLDAWGRRRPARYRGGFTAFVDSLLPAHITAMAVALLLYPGERLMPIVFAVAVAIGSKFVLRVAVDGRSRHFFNPSNFGISVALLAFPSIGLMAPYHFTENISGVLDWALPLAILMAGTMLNVRLTGKGPLILGWLGGFVAQALVRWAVFSTPLLPALLPLTGVAMILFTNYMITDPATTPVKRSRQYAFGLATAAIYGTLVSVHVVFGMFFALTVVAGTRGLSLTWLALRARAHGHARGPSVAEPVPSNVLAR
jgi:Na+-translocating ferredoxin:NAD+ oxidoreductase RnfD subunit